MDDPRNKKSIAERIELAKSGDRESAFDILEEISFSIIFDKKSPDPRYLKYLADCLLPIVEHGIDANVALNIKRRKGERHSRKTLERDRVFAMQIIEHRDLCGLTINGAIEAIILKESLRGRDIGEEVIRKAYLKHREWAENELNAPIPDFKPEEKSSEESG